MKMNITKIELKYLRWAIIKKNKKKFKKFIDYNLIFYLYT